jgi:hypothetical protein
MTARRPSAKPAGHGDRLAQFVAGDTVPVRYDRDDRSQVYLDAPAIYGRQEAAAAEQAAATAQKIQSADAVLERGGDSSTQPENAISETVSLANTLANGAPARVVVVKAEAWSPPMGDSAGHPVWHFTLTVMRDGVAPYRVDSGQGLPSDALPLVYPGANLPAKVDKSRAESVGIDSAAAQEETAGRRR